MIDPENLVRRFDENASLFHELMSFKVREILLVSSPYDAFALEEDGSLAQRIINEYNGLNLSAPPRLTHVSTVQEALQHLSKRKFDLVLCMPFVGSMDAFSVGRQIKKHQPRLPVILLTPNLHCLEAASQRDCSGVDRTYVWTRDSRLLLALIKNLEDHVNVKADTRTAMVRVLILVEDSPEYISSFLPILYQAVVQQTRSVLEESFNEEHRLLKMRARPKILLASNYEEARKLIRRYRDYVFCVMSDTRFTRKGVFDDNAGIRLLRYVRKNDKDISLLLMSSDSFNQQKAEQIPASFVDKNSSDLLQIIKGYFEKYLGFGDFVFRLPDGQEVGRAKNFKEFESAVCTIPEISFLYHAKRQHFSNWVMARSEIGMATLLGAIRTDDFDTVDSMRTYLSESIFALRKWRHQGVVADFEKHDFDPRVIDIVKIGDGSLGGKARGLAFLSSLLHSRQDIRQKFYGYPVKIPKTLVITTDIFNDFVDSNMLFYLCGGRDHIVRRQFLKAQLPEILVESLRIFLKKVFWPLAVRSSSMFEDAQYRPYAGLYETVMLPNDHQDFEVRLKQLQDAVKLVYASTFFANPRSYAKSVGQKRHDSMSVIIQQLIGQKTGSYFYPAISGVAQSYNYYPISYMKPEDGIVSMALGFGKAVVEGEKCFRFCPKYPKILPQFSTVDLMLKNTQRYFYALDMSCNEDDLTNAANLVKLEISEAQENYAINNVCSTYIEDEQRIRESGVGPKVVLFSQILKYKLFPLADIINDMLMICEKGMGGPVEIEFAVDLTGDAHKNKFYLLQTRPLIVGGEVEDVRLSEHEINKALFYSEQTLGHGLNTDIEDIILVKDFGFSLDKTPIIAREISEINSKIARRGKKYILAGPGRWGSADPLLGIPVRWHDISAVGAIVELVTEQVNVEPSQGTHFFQNITSLNIFYMTISLGKTADLFDRKQIEGLDLISETDHLLHLRSCTTFTIKVDGKTAHGVIVSNQTN
nr:phosphoenolpyruvate synthase/pyruvate phosphate dikinase [Desulfobulbaceae bacterium]